MTAKISASADGLKVTIGNAAEAALEINQTAKTIAALAPYLLKGDIAAQSLAANGYVKLASGLIIQWGTVNSSASAGVAITYPIPFPTAHMCSVASGSDTGYPVLVQVRNSSLSAGLVSAWVSSSSARVATLVSWIALGY